MGKISIFVLMLLFVGVFLMILISMAANNSAIDIPNQSETTTPDLVAYQTEVTEQQIMIYNIAKVLLILLVILGIIVVISNFLKKRTNW